ncbi:alpha,alpha-trehalase [Aureococcus anophagefferens]|uniref:Trehalase n=1 Tax=Aureococcus anophagefferens TaxID=44056 RepID=A0ABR1FVP4_AURAN
MSALESSQEEDLGAMAAAAARANLVFCSSSPVLIAAQTHHLYDDCKTFVDSPMRVDPEEILEKFKAVDAADEAAVRSFVVKHFDLPSGELATAGPPGGWTAAPAVLGELGDARDVAWARALNDLWRQLARKAAPGADRCRSSLLAPRRPFVAPGGRFREPYYWDSYWIVEGLLVCDCYGAAKDMILNLLDYVEAFGFVPNGGRTYYLNRSQPPLLSDMVRAYLDAALEADDADRAAAALALAERATPLLVTEHDWWTRNKNVQVTANGATYTLLCYRTAATLPRAESYREDLATAARAPEARRAAIYGDLAAAAESGWDFSSRWLGEPDRLETIETSRVVPADLNAIFVRFERNLAALHRFVDAARRDGKAPLRVAWARAKEDAMEPPGERFVPGARFARLASARAEAIDACLRDGAAWRDGALGAGGALSPLRDRGPALSDYFPLWAGVADDWKLRDQVQLVSSLVTSGLLSDGGAATTALNTGEQWDAPNAWPPLQFVLDAGLRRLESLPSAGRLADDLRDRWLDANREAYERTGFMHEKLDALRPGAVGGGGEYDPQLGFGWSNGVALCFLRARARAARPKTRARARPRARARAAARARRRRRAAGRARFHGGPEARPAAARRALGPPAPDVESCASPRPEARAAKFGESTICPLGERDDRPRDDDRGYANGGGYEDRGGGGGGGKSRGTALRAATQRHVGLHPLAIVGVSDHFTRVKLGGARVAPDSPVLGLLFGKQVGLDVAVFDAIELSMADGKLDHDFLKKQAELFTDVYADRELLGWYCLAKSATPAHLDLHREFLAYNESPLCLMMDPEPSAESKDLPITILEAEVQVVDDVPTMLFATLPFTLETLQAERISMEIVAKTAPTDGESALDTHVEAVDTSLRTLGSRVAVLVDYLRAVAGGKAEPDFALLRQVSGLCDTLPTGGAPDQTRDLMRDYNDALMVSYLASVTKNANAVNDLSEKFMLINARGAKLV